MENFELTAFLKALLFVQVVVHLHAIAKGTLPSFEFFCNVFLHEVLNLTRYKLMHDSVLEPVILISYFHNSVIKISKTQTLHVFLEIKEPDKAISRDGSNDGIRYVNFVEDKFSYLNITALSGGNFVDNMPECSFACLDTPSCFSFNLAAIQDVNNRFPCELLPSDKYNNSDKFVHSYTFHHFSIAVS